MTTDLRTLDLTIERMIPASPSEVFDAWLDPTHPGSPWHTAVKLIFNPAVDGLFYWGTPTDGGEKPHYGRFTVVERPRKIEHTWMSPHTRGLESIVTLTFEPSGEETRVTLRHAKLPDDELARGHEGGWAHLLAGLVEHCSKPRK
jgi:uncharacterized protein YndB with AHSA1/START domain